jgi:lipoprotein-releasing system permease protein
MNGFENELRARLTNMTGHAWVGADGGLADWRTIRASLEAVPGITAAKPVVEIEAVLARGAELSGAIVTGVDPKLEAGSPLAAGMMRGVLSDLVAGRRAMILGAALAARLGLQIGDPVSVLVPYQDAVMGLQSRLRQYIITGTFELGVKDHDGTRALVELSEAAALGGIDGRVHGLRITTADIFAAPELVRVWQQRWLAQGGHAVVVRDWTQDHVTYFRAVRIEKIMIMVLLTLIVGVAAFNIVATLVMVVTDKRGSIAILRTVGFSRSDIVRIFAVQGTVIGWIGVMVGVLGGVAIARDIGTLAPQLERLFGFEFMPADVYYLTSLPADLHWQDVVTVGVIALLLTAVATIYPALRAAAVAPAEVLRYE